MTSGRSKQEILDAARSLGARGDRASMEELAAAAGVSVRTLYRRFGGRSALLRELGCRPPPGARERVLEAALELVGRRGLTALSMDELAEAAGVSRATLYRLFPGKAALFGALVRAYSPWEAVAEVLEAMPDAPPEKVVPAVGRAIAAALAGRTALVLRIVHEVLKGDPDTLTGVKRTMGRGLPDLIRYLEAQMAAGRLRPLHPVIALQLLVGPIVVHQLTRPLAESLLGFPEPTEQVVDRMVESWLRAMAIGAPAKSASSGGTVDEDGRAGTR
ncbi:MAG TPA: TetR/AcrR family transcriptional regulator [Candidatus Dormibacteraeota bacterium]|nr:TetR/AcrR family transcriptional regulator [Candidatus Dormibacteraeota bacterium]